VLHAEIAPREKRKELAVVVGGSGDLRKRAREDPAVLDARGGRARDMQEGVEIGAREEAAQLVEGPLSAAHSGKPVVDESDLHGGAR